MNPHAPRWTQLGQGALALALCAGYAVLAHVAASAPVPALFDAAVALAPGVILTLLFAWRSPSRRLLLPLWLAGCAALWAGSGWFVRHDPWIFLLQDLSVQVLLGLAFGRSLRPGRTPLVSQFAALLRGPLSLAVARYTRRATWAWTLFFAAMAITSLVLFALAPVADWSVFANLLGLPLVGLMFGAEYAVRRCVLPRTERAGLWESVAAWRRSGAVRRAH